MSASTDERVEALIERLVKPQVRAMHAYHVAPAEGLTKLDAMENPYGWPPAMVDAWLERLHAARVNRYPDPAAGDLKLALKDALALPEGYELVLGNGSDELIQLLVLLLAGPGRTVLAPDPSFAMYRIVCEFTGSRYHALALEPDWSLDRDRALAAIAEHAPDLTFIAYPNNPTGNLFDADTVDAMIEASPGVVVVDEAYEPFARRSYVSRLAEFPNLLVMRTVSKLGLAGLRLGLLVAPPAWASELEKLRLPYNINVLSQLTACFALEHYPMLLAQVETLREERDRLFARLSELNSLEVWPSAANFLLVRVLDPGALEVAARLRERGVLVKVLHGSSPRLAECLRISVGTQDENASLLAALSEILGAS